MVNAVGNAHANIPAQARGKPAAPDAPFPGKSGDSVGHRARLMAEGSEAPNAVGKAASSIARMDVTVLAPVAEAETPQDSAADPA